jgi:hypothetical protein
MVNKENNFFMANKELRLFSVVDVEFSLELNAW